MGSNFSRNVRELFEAAGCDGIVPLDTSQSDVDGAFTNAKDAVQQTNPRPVTPVPHHRTRMLSHDPRSPSFGIVRTPIEVVATPESNKPRNLKVQCDPNAAERNYLETDLDSFDDVKPEPSTPVLPATHKLPPGLSNAHLLKLKFLGMDPRSPSEGIPRTPIQVLVSREKQSSENISKESLDASDISLSRSLFGSSDESLDISKACSEPSALVSDYEQSKDWSLSLGSMDLELGEPISSESMEAASRNTDMSEGSSNQSQESGDSLLSETPEEVRISRDELAKEIALLAEKISQTPILPKAPAGVHIFCEDSTRTPQNTPKKKSTRTPLTPICNLTPNDVTRGKKLQGKRLDKDKLVCKVLSGCENTPSKLTASVKKVKKPMINETAKLADWDHEQSIII